MMTLMTNVGGIAYHMLTITEKGGRGVSHLLTITNKGGRGPRPHPTNIADIFRK